MSRLLYACMVSCLLVVMPLAQATIPLQVYTYGSFTSQWGPGNALKQAFEAQCGCTLRYTSLDDGVSLLNRLRLEGARTRADVILGLDNSLMAQASSLAVVQPHGLALDSLQLKPELAWQSAEFVPFDISYFAFVYDARRIEQPVASMAELLAGNARIIYQDPRTSTPGQGLLMWLNQLYGDQVGQAWQQLARQTVTVTQGWSDAYSLFLQGEADYVLSYTTSPAYHLVVENEDRYRAALFSEGHPAQIEVAAISRYSQQPALARRFLEFLLSPEAQALLPTHHWMLPARQAIELPAAFDQLIQPRRLMIDEQAWQQQRAAWIRTWRTAVSR